MRIENLINFIKRQLAEGTDEKVAREALLKAGYLPIEIDEAFRIAKEPQAPMAGETPPLAPEPPPVIGEVPVGPIPPVSLKPATKGVPWSKIFIGVLIVALGASFYFYQKTAKPGPISLLPEDTGFYFRIKINPEHPQVKNLKSLLQKFPNYQKISDELQKELEKLKEDHPALEHFDFSISEEIILAYIGPLKQELEEPALVFILPNPDLKKLNQFFEDMKKEIEEGKDWKIEEETYKGRTIVKVVPTEEAKEEISESLWPEIETATTYTNGHAVLAFRTEDIKKIIDVAEDQSVAKRFQENRLKNLGENPAHAKLSKYFADEYFVLFWGQFEWSQILETASQNMWQDRVRAWPPFLDSLKAALNLPFLGGKKQAENEEKTVAAVALIAEKNELKIEAYALDSGKEAFVPAQFSFANSLAQDMPAEIGQKQVVFFGEERDLKAMLEDQINTLSKGLTPEEKEEMGQAWDDINEFLGIDVENDILGLFDKNYALFIASEPTGKEDPRLGLVFEIDDENQVKENLLKIKIPKEALGLGLEGSQSSAKDAMAMADMNQIRTIAEISYIEEWGYHNVSCSHEDIKELCADIKAQIGIGPTIHASQEAYCAYAKLNEPGSYYCIDSELTAKKTYINPGGSGYCTATTFICPQGTGTAPLLPPEELVGFEKETVNGFEIYSLPVYDKFGLNFAVQDKKLFLALTKEGLAEILESFADAGAKKLKDTKLFQNQFDDLPKNISSISYSYPYGFLGLIKWGVNLIINSMVTYMGMWMPMDMEQGVDFASLITPPIFEFLDKGIAPYLKVLKVGTSYAFVPEQGVVVGKGRLILEDLSWQEKQECEDFWENLDKWYEEQAGWLEQQLAPFMMMEEGTDMWGGSSFFQNNEKKAKEYIEQAISIMEEISIGQVAAETDVKKNKTLPISLLTP